LLEGLLSSLGGLAGLALLLAEKELGLELSEFCGCRAAEEFRREAVEMLQGQEVDEPSERPRF
jgi:hypothetical protein